MKSYKYPGKSEIFLEKAYGKMRSEEINAEKVRV